MASPACKSAISKVPELTKTGTYRTPWRFVVPFSDERLCRELHMIEARATTGPLRRGAAPEAGWFRHHSEAVVARERPGSPLANGPFERGRALLTNYVFSDPRLVEAHFDPDAPLLGRPMLLELKAYGLRYLCGVVVEDVREERTHEKSVFGYRYDTRQGHIESGCEWFLLTKSHETGDVILRIEAWWQLGNFPNWWSRLGFDLVGRRSQRAWHRLAHLRMRRLLGTRDLPRLPRAGELVHHGLPLPAPAIARVARERPTEIAVESASPGGELPASEQSAPSAP